MIYYLHCIDLSGAGTSIFHDEWLNTMLADDSDSARLIGNYVTGIDYTGWSGPVLHWGRISTIYIIKILRKNRKFEYIFVSSQVFNM